jgi:hypothetical protein
MTASQMDLLIDGELSPEARRELLAHMDDSPDGWRRLALAFLEAQSWRESFAEAARETPLPKPIAAIRPKPLRLAPWMARAAVVLAAFALGWAVHQPRIEAARTLFAQRPPDRPIPAPNRPLPSLARKLPESPGYVEGRLQREGFRVEQTRYLVPAATKDGRRVNVPVERVRVRYVGNRAV